jgi:putative glutamine amidotransferase
MIRIGIPFRKVENRYVVNIEYVQALSKAGAETVLILPSTDLNALLPTLQGLLIPGGTDIDPKQYNSNNTDSIVVDEETDHLDLTLIQASRTHKIEVFGICRGLQIINVAFGGDLIQDIPLHFGTMIDHNFSANHRGKKKGHLITIKPHSRLSNLLPSEIEVNSYHHQGIKTLAKGLSISADSQDGIIEAIEGEKLLAVQWHPERMTEDPLFQSLFDDFVQRCSL